MKQLKLYSLLAALLLSASLWAQGPWTSGDCTVTLADGVLTVSGSGSMGNKPSSSWTTNSSDKSSITTVVVGGGVTDICPYAFDGCTNLTSVTFPNSLERIKGSAFKSCSKLTSISLPNSLVRIDGSAFYGCNKLGSITIPASVNYIDAHVFWNCSLLKDVYLLPTTPPGLNTGGNPSTTFGNCHKDLKLWCPDGYDDDYMNDGTWCQYYGDKLYNAATGEHAPEPSPSGSDLDGKYHWSLSSGQLSIAGANVDMPDYSSSTVPWRYYKDYITEVVVNEGIHTISQYAFKDHSKIRIAYIEGDITSIGTNAFNGCTSLAEVYCDANPSGLTWTSPKSAFMTPQLSKKTKFYVKAAYLSTYRNNWDRGEDTDANVTFGVALNDNSASTVTELATLESSGVYVPALKIARTLYKDGAFNTLCLPFSLASLTGTPLEGAEVFEFVSAEKTETSLHINIRPVDAIEAGKPYLIRWASGENITSMVFSGVRVTASEGLEVKPEGDVAFIGTLDQTTLPTNENNLFVGANNTLYYSDGTEDLKAFRAYFRVDGSGGGAGHAPARFYILPKSPTAIENPSANFGESSKLIENGMLIIEKNGVRYNAQGQIVK